MDVHPDVVTVLGIAGSVSLLAGWRLYLCILATGLAMRFHGWPVPEHFASLRVLANGWVLGAAGLAATCEFLADKVPWFDSLWDVIHTAVRPLGGALLALALVDPADPALQAVAFILGGGGALFAHAGKASTRAVINASPEPFSNIAASSLEDLSVSGILAFVFYHPLASGVVALLLMAASIAVVAVALRMFGKLFGPLRVARRGKKPAS